MIRVAGEPDIKLLESRFDPFFELGELGTNLGRVFRINLHADKIIFKGFSLAAPASGNFQVQTSQGFINRPRRAAPA